MKGFLDRIADKVQRFTGEKERRELVDETKKFYNNIYRPQINKNVREVNNVVSSLNSEIVNINTMREKRMELPVIRLNEFLGKFGSIKAMSSYCDEVRFYELSLPYARYEEINNYVSEIDWSKSEVFFKTFFNPFSVRSENKKNNHNMRMELINLKIELKRILDYLEIKKKFVGENLIIATEYKNCVEMVIEYIEDVILPELEIVETFFQSIKIKNEILANNKITNIDFAYDIKLLKGTVYEKHYIFIKNTFMFYIIACKIFSTPILSKLLSESRVEIDDAFTTESDLLRAQIKSLEIPKVKMNSNLTFIGSVRN